MQIPATITSKDLPIIRELQTRELRHAAKILVNLGFLNLGEFLKNLEACFKSDLPPTRWQQATALFQALTLQKQAPTAESAINQFKQLVAPEIVKPEQARAALETVKKALNFVSYHNKPQQSATEKIRGVITVDETKAALYKPEDFNIFLNELGLDLSLKDRIPLLKISDETKFAGFINRLPESKIEITQNDKDTLGKLLHETIVLPAAVKTELFFNGTVEPDPRYRIASLDSNILYLHGEFPEPYMAEEPPQELTLPIADQITPALKKLDVKIPDALNPNKGEVRAAFCVFQYHNSRRPYQTNGSDDGNFRLLTLITQSFTALAMIKKHHPPLLFKAIDKELERLKSLSNTVTGNTKIWVDGILSNLTQIKQNEASPYYQYQRAVATEKQLLTENPNLSPRRN